MKIVLSERHLEIMQVLWEKGSATVSEVQEALADEMAYTTVLTMLRRLEEKGYVSRAEEGRAHRYFAAVDSQAARQSALKRMTRGLFKGSPELLIAELVSQEKLSPDQLRRIRQIIDEQQPEGDE